MLISPCKAGNVSDEDRENEYHSFKNTKNIGKDIPKIKGKLVAHYNRNGLNANNVDDQ